jgi:hypothetical protein
MAQPTVGNGDEKQALRALLDHQRHVMLEKLEGVDDRQLRRVALPSGANLLGLVRHLAAVEYAWFCSSFGVDHEVVTVDGDAHRVGPDETPAGILALYARARLAADGVIATHHLDTEGIPRTGQPVSLRRVIVHVTEETARHAGQADACREPVDGTTGHLSG